MKKKIATRSLLLLISKLLPVAVQLLIIFIFSRRLSYDDYGSYQSIWLYIGVLSAIGLFGLPSLLLSSSLQNILTWIKENKKTAIPIFVLLNLLPIVYLLTMVQHFTIGTKLLLLTVLIAQNISIIIETIAIKNENEKRVVISNIIFAAFFLTWHLYVLNSGYSLIKLLPGLLLLYIIKSLFLLQKKNNALPDQHTILAEDNIGKQWLYLGINDVLGMLFKWLDKWVILLLVTTAQFAVYFNGAYEIPIFALLVSAVGNIMIVEMSKKKSATSGGISELFATSSLLLASIVFPSFCFLLFYYQDFFTLFFSEKYLASIPFFVISIFILPARITNYTVALQVFHKSDIIVKGAVLDIGVAILLMLVLYPFLDFRGIALAFVLSTYIQIGYYLWHTGKLLNKRIIDFFPIKKLVGWMLFALAITCAGKFSSVLLSSMSRLVIGICVCGIASVGLFLYYFFQERKSI
ncbi:hypothetical protein LK994_13130 [Ferruginibacter lapsinanis]|uniref:lipopolysaccharide biosynthesis protein n=1 Tax=Ferruginibacter lapsinanis TaxID=563172 RepID=UPI001E4FFCA0|nr:hypothetical protein [Ferruginibacter lapsinanis]UEG49578.1 hypothetical protein LK994_13130 [Ferruginibacter lapsinanis]